MWLRTVRRVDYRPRLGDVRVPTLLLVGRRDPQTPPPCSQELAAGIPHTRLVIFENSGHSPFIEEPEKFCQEISSFLQENLSAEGAELILPPR
jgi:proline iminopeptidase